MSRLLKTNLGSANTIAAGQTAVINLGPGPIYQRLYVECTADLGAGVVPVPEASWATIFDSIKIKANGQSVVEFNSAADLVMLNKYYGTPFTDGGLLINLTRPHMRSPWGEDQFGFASHGLQQLQLEFKINAAAAINSLSVVSEHTGATIVLPNGERMHRTWPNSPHYRLTQISVPVAATGEVHITDVPLGGDFALAAVHIATASVGRISLRANNSEHALETGITRNLAQVQAGRTPQAGWTHVDFLTDNRIISLEPLNLVDYRLVTEFTGTGNFPVLLEFLEGGIRRV